MVDGDADRPRCGQCLFDEATRIAFFRRDKKACLRFVEPGGANYYRRRRPVVGHDTVCSCICMQWQRLLWWPAHGVFSCGSYLHGIGRANWPISMDFRTGRYPTHAPLNLNEMAHAQFPGPRFLRKSARKFPIGLKFNENRCFFVT